MADYDRPHDNSLLEWTNITAASEWSIQLNMRRIIIYQASRRRRMPGYRWSLIEFELAHKLTQCNHSCGLMFIHRIPVNKYIVNNIMGPRVILWLCGSRGHSATYHTWYKPKTKLLIKRYGERPYPIRLLLVYTSWQPMHIDIREDICVIFDRKLNIL